MGEVFVISDTHLGHRNVLAFEHDGQPLRPFKSLAEMHVTIVEQWNAVVKPGDKVYHLGDVAFTKDALKIIALLNGKKRLIRGNHDLFKTRLYMEYFTEIYGVRQIDGLWLTHVPMALECVEQERVKMNVHGHLHAKLIDHPKYLNVCVEQVNYTPVSIDEIKSMSG